MTEPMREGSRRRNKDHGIAAIARDFAAADAAKKRARKAFIEAMAAASNAGYSLVRQSGSAVWVINPDDLLSNEPLNFVPVDAMPPVLVDADRAKREWRAASAKRGALLRKLLRAAS